MTIELDVAKRTGSAAKARTSGKVPGIVYGPKQEPIAVETDKTTFEKVLSQAGESTILNLKGLDESVEVLIHDVAFNAARGGVEHVDFYAIERGKELTTHVPLHFVGESPLEKTGASVNKALTEIEVTCRPSALPNHIDVDVSALDSEEAQIHVKDLTIPSGVKVETEGDILVAMIAHARAEEPEETATVDMDAIEVEAKGKKEEESAEGE